MVNISLPHYVGFLFLVDGWENLVALLGFSDQTGFSINNLEGRSEIWSRAIYGIQDFPITGMGMNTFREIVHVLYPLFLISPDVDLAHAHNEYLQAALDLGIPGLIAFLALHITAIWMLRNVWKTTQQVLPNSRRNLFASPEMTHMIVLGLFGGLVAHMIFGLTDAITLGAKPGVLWWMLMGLIAALHAQVSTSNFARDMFLDEKTDSS